MLPHAVCDIASGFFLSASPPARPACAQKTKHLHKAGVWHTGCEVGHRRTTRGTGTQLREKCFRDWTGDWERKDSFYKNALFPSRHSDKIHVPILTADRHPAFIHMTTNGAITVSDVGAVRPKPPGSASQGFLLFSCGCLIRACIMA